MNKSDDGTNLIKRALRRHRNRLRNQMTIIGAFLFLCAVSYPLSSLLAETSVASYTVFSITLCIILFVIWGWHATRYQETMRAAWKLALQKACDAHHTNKVVEGYTELFDLYVKTKRRSYHLLSWGLLALTFVIAGSIALLNSGPGAPTFMVLAAFGGLAIQVVFGILLFHQAYATGSAYVPGSILVGHTVFLSGRAGFPNAPERETTDRVNEATAKFQETNPWWFISGTGRRADH